MHAYLDLIIRLMAYRKEMGEKDEGFLGIGLSSRKNLCVHPEVSFVLIWLGFPHDLRKVSKERNGIETDAACRSLTAPWIRNESTKSCSFYENLEDGIPKYLIDR